MATTAKPVKHADGTIKWRVRFRLRPGSNPVSETFHDADEANRFAALVDRVGGEAARKVRTMSTETPNALTLNEAFQGHMDRIAGHATKGTVARYRRMWARHVEPQFGAWPTTALERGQVEIWIGLLRDTETVQSVRRRKIAQDEGSLPPEPEFLSAKTIANIQGLLSSVLEGEVREDRLARNVARGVRLPRTRRTRRPVFLTTGEFARLLDATVPEWRTFISLIAGTGLRWGEVTALTPGDLDLDQRVPAVRVSEAWQANGAGGGYVLAPPKTDRGIRTVSLPGSLVSLLREQMEGLGRDDLLFRGPRGGRLTDGWFYPRVWNPAREGAGLGSRPRIHDLRHSHASWLISAGVPLTVIQRRLGHSSIRMTSDVYGHLAPAALEQAALATELALTEALPEIEG